MAYRKTTWVDQNVERPKTYEFTNNSDGSTTLIESFGNVVTLGTPVNAANMNHIEDGIEAAAITIYKNTETYNQGEWVLGSIGGEKGIFESLIDENLGNPLSDSASWGKVHLGGKGEIGEIRYSLLPLTNSGLHLLDGALISGSGAYADFVDYIADLYTADPTASYFTTEANWQSSVSTYGVCGKFVYDSVNNTVRLPKVTGFIEGTIDSSALGDLVVQGLPPVFTTTTTQTSVSVYVPNTGWGVSGVPPSTINQGTLVAGSGNIELQEILESLNGTTTGRNADVTQGATSTSTSSYGSGKVQPQSIKGFVYIVISTSAKTDIQVDIDDIATDLNGKADTDLSNISPSASGRNTIAGWSMPDFANSIQVSLPYTAPSNGYLLEQVASSGYVDLLINGSTSFYSGLSTENATRTLMYPIKVNDVITRADSNGNWYLYFIPVKGAN